MLSAFFRIPLLGRWLAEPGAEGTQIALFPDAISAMGASLEEESGDLGRRARKLHG